MCQCPKRGNLHFYTEQAATDEEVVGCVNALKGATFISTAIRAKSIIQASPCVNALKGATFISTPELDLSAKAKINVCQCPKRGNLHFYTKEENNGKY